MKKPTWLSMLGALLIVTSLSGCAGDKYQQQADVIKGHVELFYGHLQSHQVDQAVSENEQIEVIALSAEERLLRRVGQMTQGEKTQEWKIIKTAKETAAENWLALARYFSENQQYDKARGTYRRIIETFQGSPYHLYVDRAKMGLRDVEVILDPETLPLAPSH
jgi:Tfp pilus assembly protein PilF